MAEMGRPLPKFGEWDVNDPASAEGFTVIFNKARDEKKKTGSGAKPDSPDNNHPFTTSSSSSGKQPTTPPKKWFCCIQHPSTAS